MNGIAVDRKVYRIAVDRNVYEIAGDENVYGIAVVGNANGIAVDGNVYWIGNWIPDDRFRGRTYVGDGSGDADGRERTHETTEDRIQEEQVSYKNLQDRIPGFQDSTGFQDSNVTVTISPVIIQWTLHFKTSSHFSNRNFVCSLKIVCYIDFRNCYDPYANCQACCPA